jgi:long-subunit fatty acid transport protein
VGVEGQPLADVPVTALAGYSFETAAAPDEFVTVMTVDGDRHLAALGAGYQRGRLAFHATLGYVFVSDRQVAPEVGRSPQLNPIRDDTDEPLEVFVNWGTYRSSWLIAGAGVSGSF